MKGGLVSKFLLGTAALLQLVPLFSKPEAEESQSVPIENKKSKISLSVDNNYETKSALGGVFLATQPSWRPAVNVNYSNGNSNFGASVSGQKKFEGNEWSKVCVGASYFQKLGERLNVLLANTYLHHKSGDEWKDTGLATGKVSYGPFSLSQSVAYGAITGKFGGVSYNNKYKISDKVDLGTSVALEWNDRFARGETGISDFKSVINTAIKLAKNVDLKAEIGYINSLSELPSDWYLKTGISYSADK